MKKIAIVLSGFMFLLQSCFLEDGTCFFPNQYDEGYFGLEVRKTEYPWPEYYFASIQVIYPKVLPVTIIGSPYRIPFSVANDSVIITLAHKNVLDTAVIAYKRRVNRDCPGHIQVEAYDAKVVSTTTDSLKIEILGATVN